MKKFKGFTLVELVVVMVIMAILMGAIMQLFKPLGDVYAQGIHFESKQTVHNGIIKYLAESTRFATHIAIDNKSKTPDVAVEKFLGDLDDFEHYQKRQDAAVWDTSDIIKIHVIAIDNAGTEVDGVRFNGRLRKGVYDYDRATNTFVNSPATAVSDMRMALGSAFYGPENFSISLKLGDSASLRGAEDPEKDAIAALTEDWLEISVTSLLAPGKIDRTETGGDFKVAGTDSKRVVTTYGEARLSNVNDVGGMLSDDRYVGTDNGYSTQVGGDPTFIVYVTRW